LLHLYLFFFFFQAEDGIRDFHVTGVQTCALPILQYDYVLEDSILTLDRSLEFSSMAKFRGQELDQTLQIPYNKPFVLDKSILPILEGTIYSNGYKLKDVNSRNHWVYNENGLLCLNCVNDHKTSEQDSLSRAMFSESYFME